MSGTAHGTSSTSANLAIAGTLFLAATVAGTSSHAAALEAHAYMSGTSAGVASESASMELLSEMSASVNCLALASGDLKGAARLSAFSPSIAGGSAALSLESKMSGLSAGVTTTSAYLRIGEVLMSGTAAGIASSTAALSLDGVALSASVAGLCGTQAALSLASKVSALVAGVASQTGALSLGAALSGTSAGVAAPTGALSIAGVAVSGTAAGVASQTGALSLASKVSGTSAGIADEQAAMTTTMRLSGTAAGVASQGAVDLTITSSGFVATDIDWAAWWDSADRVDASGVASSLPNSATGADDAGTTADIIYASGDRPTIDDTITAANNQPGLIFNADAFGITGSGTWWELSSTSGKMILVHLAIHGGTTGTMIWWQTASYASRGGLRHAPRNYTSSTSQVEESGGAVDLANSPTAANVPVPTTVPVVTVLEYDGRGGSGIVKFVSKGVRDAGAAGTIGIIEANTNSGLGHGGATAASKTAIGTHLLGGLKRSWLTWLEDAQLLDLLETDYAVTGHHCIHRMAPILHLTSRATVVSSEFSHWLHLQTGLLGFTNSDASERPAESTLAGLPAPYFRGNTELNFLDSSTGAIGLISNIAEYHVFIVFQSNNQSSGSAGSGGYWTDAAFLSGVDGFWAISMADAGQCTFGFASDTDGDVEVWTSGGHDDNGLHVLHAWWSLADTEIGIQIDDETAVTDTVTDGPATQTDLMRVGANYAPNQELEATMHIWAHGAMTSGEITDFYAMLAFRYGVTVP